MDLPAEAVRTNIELPSGVLQEVWRWQPLLAEWVGERLSSTRFPTYFRKPLVGPRLFPELAIVAALKKQGWKAVWLDSWHQNKIWDGMIDVSEQAVIPDDVRATYRGVLDHLGVWDVFAWSADRALFAESKRPLSKRRHEPLTPPQLQWLVAAVASGLPIEFLIVDWLYAVEP